MSAAVAMFASSPSATTAPNAITQVRAPAAAHVLTRVWGVSAGASWKQLPSPSVTSTTAVGAALVRSPSASFAPSKASCSGVPPGPLS